MKPGESLYVCVATPMYKYVFNLLCSIILSMRIFSKKDIDIQIDPKRWNVLIQPDKSVETHPHASPTALLHDIYDLRIPGSGLFLCNFDISQLSRVF